MPGENTLFVPFMEDLLGHPLKKTKKKLFAFNEICTLRLIFSTFFAFVPFFAGQPPSDLFFQIYFLNLKLFFIEKEPLKWLLQYFSKNTKFPLKIWQYLAVI
jgi:hypothetical protein